MSNANEEIRDEQSVDARQAVDRLSDRTRVLLEARMLPADRDLNREELTDVRERFNAYVEAHRGTLAQVALEIRYAASTLSEWAQGKYRGDNQKFTRAINDWMERDTRRRQAKRSTGYVQTWVAESIRAIALIADKRCMIAALVAPAGSGKTMVLKALAEELRGHYVYCHRDWGVRAFLLGLTEAMGLKMAKATKAALLHEIIRELRGTHRILLLDEAHQLGPSIGMVRSIHDEAKVPVVMAGTADILSHINDRTDGRGQLSSRCISFNVLDQIRNAENPKGGSSMGRDLFSIEEIRAFFATRKIKLAADALQLMWRVACLPNYGTLRRIESIATTAAAELYVDSETISRDQLVATMGMLMSEAAYVLKVVDRADASDPAGEKSKVA